MKWLSLFYEKNKQFIDQYHERWVNYGESNQFARAGPIDNNNGLETIDKDMKNIRVLRDKQKIGSLIINDLTIQKVGPLKTTQGSIIVMGIQSLLKSKLMGRFFKKIKRNLKYREGSTMFLVKSICFRIFYRNYEILYENV